MSHPVELRVGSKVAEAALAVNARLPDSPQVAIILGSGLSGFSAVLEDPLVIPYDEIPHFPPVTVPGQVGRLVYGRVGNLSVITAQGRFHYYEGHDLATVALPVRLFAQLGVATLIITNAAGCLNRQWSQGGFMLVTGHLDCTYLDGIADPRPVLGEPYHSQELLVLARQAAREVDVPVHEGIYAWTLGPSFETPAEIRHIQSLGGAAVGMSTVPEIRAASDEGLKALTVSMLANYAAGIKDQPLSHAHVLAAAQRAQAPFTRWVTAILERMVA